MGVTRSHLNDFESEAGSDSLIVVPGDVSDPSIGWLWAPKLSVWAGSTLWSTTPQSSAPPHSRISTAYPLDVLRQVYEVNVVAPLALLQEFLPLLRRSHGVVVNVTSDAAVEGYEGWGGYGSSKAALEQLTRVLAAEEPDVDVYWVDPGDMNTQMQQEAFPGEDVSDRPLPETSVPGFLHLIEKRPPSNRYQARGPAVTIGFEMLDFDLPRSLERGRPPEQRDDVRLMVGSVASQIIVDARFGDLPDFLNPGDALVINTSATVPAAIDARTDRGEQVVVHFSSRLPSDLWTVEVRHPDGLGSLPYPDFAGGYLRLDGGAIVEAFEQHPRTGRLWLTKVDGIGDVIDYLNRFGRPIRYGYAKDRWPLEAYQTVYALQPGSAEMPSAGRPFTAEIITELIARGVAVLPLVLHAGVASLEEGEHPAEEFYSVPAATAIAANALALVWRAGDRGRHHRSESARNGGG